MNLKEGRIGEKRNGGRWPQCREVPRKVAAGFSARSRILYPGHIVPAHLPLPRLFLSLASPPSHLLLDMLDSLSATFPVPFPPGNPHHCPHILSARHSGSFTWPRVPPSRW